MDRSSELLLIWDKLDDSGLLLVFEFNHDLLHFFEAVVQVDFAIPTFVAGRLAGVERFITDTYGFFLRLLASSFESKHLHEVLEFGLNFVLFIVKLLQDQVRLRNQIVLLFQFVPLIFQLGI